MPRGGKGKKKGGGEGFSGGGDVYSTQDQGEIVELELTEMQQSLFDQAEAAKSEAREREIAVQTTNALPSIPSISNVGTVAPTGSINWNAVPGGFQPLPQTAGRSKKLYQLSQFHILAYL